jgi:hypothetical protein
VLPRRSVLSPAEGGRRGVELPDGIQLQLVEADRAQSMATVSVHIEEAGEEDEGAEVVLRGSEDGISWHLWLRLPADRAVLELEARIQNTTWEAVPYNPGLALGIPEEPIGATFAWAGGGLTGEAQYGRLGIDERGWRRFESGGRLQPRQVDTWIVQLSPVSGLAGVSHANTELAAYVGTEKIQIQTSAKRENCKLLVLTETGQTLEAVLDLYPEHVVEIPYHDLPAKAVALVVQDSRGDELIRTDKSDVPRPMPAHARDVGTPETDELEAATFDLSKRHLAYTLLGMQELKLGAYSAASERFEQALLYNGEDPILWWAKAASSRLSGREELGPELPNAHYLAPLEPLLRAEALLGQGVPEGREPNPLLAPLRETPDDFLEVACQLIEHNLLDQAHRWIDEAIRHRDLAMLRYLLAYALLLGTRMEMEAANHVTKAAQAELPPYPWRPVERQAIRVLAERFPQDEALALMMLLI